MRAGILDYDAGNIPSVTKAVERLGVETLVIESAEGVDDGLDAIVFPGVGHFGACARNLTERGLDGALRSWADDGKPLLAICVGLQLLCARSEEDPEAHGLGLVEGEVRRLKARKVPHMGWNTVEASPFSDLLGRVARDDMVYFVHSYYVDVDPSIVIGTTTYEHEFCSAIEQDNIVGVQFHPEKSAEVGRRVLQAFFERISAR